VRGLEVRGAPSYPYVCVGCQHNIFQRLTMHDNGATGLMLRGENTIANQVLDSDFHNNHDASGGNSDGIAFKDGTGTGNLIRGCRGFHNSDDGLDLSGFADPVRVDHFWSFGNGVNRWNIAEFTGGGNGLQLGGGSPTPNVAHVVTNSAAWDNTGYGFTESANTGALRVANNTAFRNAKDGFAFFFSAATLRNNLALANNRDAALGATTVEDGNSWNQTGWTTTALRSGDPREAEGARRPDGTLPATSFLANRRDQAVGAPMTG
jgi:pectate disaccharide-lyase